MPYGQWKLGSATTTKEAYIHTMTQSHSIILDLIQDLREEKI
jgi:hypothetical protein